MIDFVALGACCFKRPGGLWAQQLMAQGRWHLDLGGCSLTSADVRAAEHIHTTYQHAIKQNMATRGSFCSAATVVTLGGAYQTQIRKHRVADGLRDAWRSR